MDLKNLSITSADDELPDLDVEVGDTNPDEDLPPPPEEHEIDLDTASMYQGHHFDDDTAV